MQRHPRRHFLAHLDAEEAGYPVSCNQEVPEIRLGPLQLLGEVEADKGRPVLLRRGGGFDCYKEVARESVGKPTERFGNNFVLAAREA